MKFLKKLIKRFFNLGNKKKIIKPYRVNVLYYSKKTMYNGKISYNVGDYLSVIVFKLLMSRFGIKSFKSKKTYAISFIGSIIQFIGQDAIVYGSGFIYKSAAAKFAENNLKLDIRAVRGPLTHNLLTQLGYKVPCVYGDPAILLPLLYTPQYNIKKTNYRVIPHKSKLEKYEGYNILSPLTDDWQVFIESIVSSNLIISSSLHGIIIAESYGVQAVLLDDTEHLDKFKYKDYYYSTGRYNIVTASSVEEALLIKPMNLPDLSKLQKGLLEAFPKEIFTEHD